ncbi:MAG: AsmA family protein [Acidobacteriota bacterium]
MSRRVRSVLIIIAALFVVLLVLPFFIPVNQFRPIIENEASSALGRRVTFGNLSLSIFTGSMSAQNLSIADDPKFSRSPFLTAKSVKVGVELMPLIFSRKLNVTGITIDSPQVTLIRNSAGRWNYSSLGGPATELGRQAPGAAGPSGPPPEVSIRKLGLRNGTIIIGSTGSPKRSTYDHVNVTASDVSMQSRFPVVVSAGLPGGGNFKFDGKVGPLDRADASLTPFDARLDVSSLDLASTGFLDPSAGLGGVVDLNATMSSQNGEANTDGTAKLSKALLVAGGSPSTEPVTVDFHTRYDLRKETGVLNPSTLKIGNAAAHLSGTYQTAGDATVVNIKLDGQNMPARDLQSFLPALGVNMPKGATLQSGTLNANLNLTGPTNKLVTTGNVGLMSAKLAGFDLGSRMSAISALAGIKTGKDLLIEKLTTNVQIAPRGLKAENFLLVIPSLGRLVGAGTIDSRNNLDFKMAATVTNAAATAGSPVANAIGLLGKLTGGGCKGQVTVPFLVHGTTADPKFVPDVGGLAAAMLKSQSGCTGSTTSGAKKTQTPANPLQSIQDLFGKKKKNP